MDNAYDRVKGKGKQAALDALDEVMQELEDRISDGTLRPYRDDHDVFAP